LKYVVNPDDVCAEYGVDTFRLYEMFMGPLAESAPWNPRDIPGCRRFLERAWKLLVDPESGGPIRPALARPAKGEPEGAALELERALHRCIKRVDDSFQHFNFNTAIAGFMTWLNEAAKRPGALTRSQAERFVLALSPFARTSPRNFGRVRRARRCSGPWPRVDPRWLLEEEIEFGRQRQVVRNAVPRA
jgi:leucyl-tRNA synthetase